MVYLMDAREGVYLMDAREGVYLMDAREELLVIPVKGLATTRRRGGAH